MKIDTKTLLVGGALVIGAGYALLHICGNGQGRCGPISKIVDEWLYGNRAPHNTGPDSVPWGGGTQETPAGTRYLAGPDDLPPITDSAGIGLSTIAPRVTRIQCLHLGGRWIPRVGATPAKCLY